MPVTSASEREKQEKLKFKASLSYVTVISK